MACCALWVRPGATPLMLAMLPTVMVVAVTPVAVAPPLPPAGAWLPLAPQGPRPEDRGRAAGWRRGGAPLVAPGCEPPDEPPPGAPLASAAGRRARGRRRGRWCSTSRPWRCLFAFAAVVEVVVDELDDVEAQGVELPAPSAWAPVPVPLTEPELPERPKAPWASAAWLPVRREPQAEASQRQDGHGQRDGETLAVADGPR